MSSGFDPGLARGGGPKLFHWEFEEMEPWEALDAKGEAETFR